MKHAEPIRVPANRKPAPARSASRPALAEQWAAATAEPVRPLPGRADLERRFGTSLTGVRVFAGPAARSLLRSLDARGAASGSTILLGDVDPATVVHEVAHVLQAGSGAGSAVSSSAPIPTPLPVDHPAEREAESLARSPGPARVRTRLTPGALALRRTALLERDPEVATAEPAAGFEELAAPAVSKNAETVEDANTLDSSGGPEESHADPERTAGDAEESAATTDGADDSAAEASATNQPNGSPQESAADAGPDAQAGQQTTPVEPEAADRAGSRGSRRDAPAGPPPAGRDRHLQLVEVIGQAQQTWDAGSRTAADHDIRPCPSNATQPGSRPFARGPPPPVPQIAPLPPVPSAQPAEPDPGPAQRAKERAQEQVDRAPARAPPSDTAGLTSTELQERSGQQQVLDRRIRSAAGSAPKRVEPPPTPFTGAAEPGRAEVALTRFREASARTVRSDHARTDEDFGENRLAPARDPTAGHDVHLDGLEIPQVDVAAAVDQNRLDRVATAENAGAVPIRQAVVVPDADLARLQEDNAGAAATRARIDEEIADTDQRIEQSCGAAARTRTELQTQAGTGTQTRRDDWRTESQALLRHWDDEADRRHRQAVSDAERAGTDATQRATTITADAQSEATRQWGQTQTRAQAKVAQSADRSWFTRGVDWLREQVARLAEWIDGFIDGCRQAINGLLDAAAALAHQVVDAARSAIAATFQGLHAALDVIADNLPGELGELARRHRDEVHRYLDSIQAQLDTWADDLDRAIDEEIEGLRGALNQVLDDLQAGATVVAAALDGLLANGLLGFLQNRFPLLAALIEEGLDGPVNRAAERLDGWVDQAMEATGLTALDRMLDDLQIDQLCSARPDPGEAARQAQDCAAFRQGLIESMDYIDTLLASPAAVRIQQFMQEMAAQQLGGQLSAVEDFFDIVHTIAQPVYQWWQQVQPVVEQAIDGLGEIASAIWQHVAVALGVDPRLGPIEALRQGIQALWQLVVAAARPLLDALAEAWRWLREDSALAPFFRAIAALPELWSALGDLWNRMSQGAADWLASAAETLSRTVLPVVNRVLGAVSGVLVAAVGAIDRWGTAVLGVVEAVLSWRPGIALLDAVLRALDRITAPIRRLLAAARSCLIRAMRYLAVQLRDLAAHASMLLDVAVGLTFALLTLPIGLVGFLAGNIWLHVLPECYKAPLLNFLLEAAIRFLLFLPEPAELDQAIVYQGLLNFLIGVRVAPDQQKIGAVNMIASLWAGNAAFAAGFVVGIAKGVWDATGGTLIFLLEAAVWLAALPFKLAMWAGGMVSGTLFGTTVQRQPAGEQSAPERQQIAERGDSPGQPEPPAPAQNGGPGNPAGPPEARVRMRTRMQGDIHITEAIAERSEVAPSSADLPAPVGQQPGSVSPATIIQPDEQNEPAGGPAEGQQLDADDGADTGTPAVGEAGQTLQPPAAPGGLGDLRGTLVRLVTEGLSAEDVRQLVETAKGVLRSVVGRLARMAATAMLDAINQPGAAYELGKIVGGIVGQFVVEAILAALTAGASAAISAAKVAIQGARVTSKFAGVINKLHKLLEPIFALVKKLRSAISELIGLIQKWIDDVLRWMRGIGRRIRGRLRPGRGPHAPRPHGPSRPHGPHGRGKPHHHSPTPAEVARAVEEARALVLLMHARHASLPKTLLALNVLRLQFPFIEGFSAEDKVGRHAELYLLASKHPIGEVDEAPAAVHHYDRPDDELVKRASHQARGELSRMPQELSEQLMNNDDEVRRLAEAITDQRRSGHGSVDRPIVLPGGFGGAPAARDLRSISIAGAGQPDARRFARFEKGIRTRLKNKDRFAEEEWFAHLGLDPRHLTREVAVGGLHPGLIRVLDEATYAETAANPVLDPRRFFQSKRNLLHGQAPLAGATEAELQRLAGLTRLSPVEAARSPSGLFTENAADFLAAHGDLSWSSRYGLNQPMVRGRSGQISRQAHQALGGTPIAGLGAGRATLSEVGQFAGDQQQLVELLIKRQMITHPRLNNEKQLVDYLNRDLRDDLRRMLFTPVR